MQMSEQSAKNFRDIRSVTTLKPSADTESCGVSARGRNAHPSVILATIPLLYMKQLQPLLFDIVRYDIDRTTTRMAGITD
jgi:hypothetical protein